MLKEKHITVPKTLPGGFNKVLAHFAEFLAVRNSPVGEVCFNSIISLLNVVIPPIFQGFPPFAFADYLNVTLANALRGYFFTAH